mgnify:CR=1 FL=1
MNADKTNSKSSQTCVSVSVTDVRIGNLILNDYGEIQPIYGVDEKSILTKIEENGWSLSFKPKGIPITEEILLKLGFEVIYRSNFTLRLDHKENFKFGAGWNLVNGHFHIRFIGEQFTNIKCVHELQNLYFSITGSELQIGSITEH